MSHSHTHRISSLIDTLLEKGVSRRHLHDQIQHELSQLYQLQTGDDRRVKVVFDDLQGLVKVFAGNDEVTPQDFLGSAQPVVLSLLQDELAKANRNPAPANSTQVQQSSLQSGVAGKVMGYIFRAFFTLYHGVYLLLFSLGTYKFISMKGWAELSQLSWATIGLVLTACMTPVVAVGWLAYTRQFSSKVVSRVFFKYELPIIVTTLIAATLPLSITSMKFLAAGIVLIPLLIIFKLKKSQQLYDFLARYLAYEYVFYLASYILILYLFIWPMAIYGIVDAFFLDWQFVFKSSLVSLIGLTFSSMFGIVFLGATLIPFVVFYYLFKQWRKRHGILAQTKFDAKLKKALMYAPAVGTILVWSALSYQPNLTYEIELLRSIPQKKSFEARQEIARDLLPRQKQLVDVLDNYSKNRKWLFSQDDIQMGDAYRDMTEMEWIEDPMNDLFNLVAAPLVNRHSVRNYTLRENFRSLFGYHVGTKPETKLDVVTGAHSVRIDSQEVDVTTDESPWLATVSITQTFSNTTTRDQEVIYEFSLPTEAVVTDLKLGPNLEFSGQIAPRGAARRVYEREVRQIRDPALLEQIGPRQYRLRVFPIPGFNDKTTLDGKPQKVQFSYVVAATTDGFPLPTFTRANNVLTIPTTSQATINGENANVTANAISIGNMRETFSNLCGFSAPLVVPSQGDTVLELVPHMSQPALTAFLGCDDEGNYTYSGTLSNKQIGILFDVSYLNEDSQLWDQLVKYLTDNPRLLQENTVTLHLVNSQLSQPMSIKSVSDLPKPVYFGEANLSTALLDTNLGRYDVMFVLSNPAYISNISESQVAQSRLDSATYYFVHDSRIPAYPDELNRLLAYYPGYVSTSVESAFDTAAIRDMVSRQPYLGKLLMITPYWTVVGEGTVDALSARFSTQKLNTTQAIAARALMQHTVTEYPIQLSNPQNVGILDQFNEFAVQHRIVTPFSSLLALVNDRQQQNLNQQVQLDNRYLENRIARNPVDLNNVQLRSLSAPAPGMFGATMDVSMERAPTNGGLSGSSNMMAIDSQAGFFEAGPSLGDGFGLFVIANIAILGLGGVGFVGYLGYKRFKK